MLVRLSVLPVIALICPLSLAQAETGDVAEGEAVFRNRCAECHELPGHIPAGPENRDRGPTLVGLWGRQAGSVPGYAYSPAMLASGLVWDEATLSAYLVKPKTVVPQNRMAFTGLKRPGELEDLIAYLRAVTE
jgi:cytochrome c